jgi:photosystem II stability/assembly factor-like uncharacterized protein
MFVAAIAIACRPTAAASVPPSGFNPAAVAESGPVELAVGGSSSLTVARSDDGGATWTLHTAAAPVLTTVALLDGQRAVGATACTTAQNANGATGPVPSSCLFSSADGGATWSDAGLGRLVDPSFSSAVNGWAHTPFDPASAPNSILSQTSDGGRSWSAIASPCSGSTPSVEQAVQTEASGGFVLCMGPAPNAPALPWSLWELAAGRSATLRHDSSAADIPNDHTVFGMAWAANGAGLLWANELVFASADRGATWTLVSTRTVIEGNLGRGFMTSATSAEVSAVSTGNRNGVVRTTDGGKTWAAVVSWPFDFGPVSP